MINVIISGCRSFSDYDFLRKTLEGLISGDVVIFSGCAKGCDMMGERYAAEHGLTVRKFPPLWEKYGRGAGIVRNREMAEAALPCGLLIAFWDGKSRGTGNMIKTAEKKGLQVTVIKI